MMKPTYVARCNGTLVCVADTYEEVIDRYEVWQRKQREGTGRKPGPATITKQRPIHPEWFAPRLFRRKRSR